MMRDKSLFSNKIFKSSLTMLAAGLISLGGMNVAQAQSIPPTACDPEYMDALKAKAWMEAQREVAHNKSFIYKPDSVMVYSCFDKMVGALFRETGKNSWLFSDNPTPWGNVENKDEKTIENIKEIIEGSLDSYLGMGYKKTLNAPRHGSSEYSPSISAGSYSCSKAKEIWDTYLMADFIVKGEDEFHTFKWYSGTDPRKNYGLDSTKNASDVKGLAGKDWDEHMSIAYNTDDGMFIPADKAIDDTEYEEDDIVTHLDKILPPGIGDPAPGSCSEVDPIPTGIDIDRDGNGDTDGDNEGPEKVCPNPGCVYNISSEQCENGG